MSSPARASENPKFSDPLEQGVCFLPHRLERCPKPHNFNPTIQEQVHHPGGCRTNISKCVCINRKVDETLDRKTTVRIRSGNVIPHRE